MNDQILGGDFQNALLLVLVLGVVTVALAVDVAAVAAGLKALVEKTHGQ